MKRLILGGLLALAPALAMAANVTGAWTIHGDFGDTVKYTVICSLTEDGGGALAGPCRDVKGGPAMTASGKVAGQSVELSYDTSYQGAPIHLDYKGDVQTDGSLKGVVDAGGPQGTFTATRN